MEQQEQTSSITPAKKEQSASNPATTNGRVGLVNNVDTKENSGQEKMGPEHATKRDQRGGVSGKQKPSGGAQKQLNCYS